MLLCHINIHDSSHLSSLIICRTLKSLIISMEGFLLYLLSLLLILPLSHYIISSFLLKKGSGDLENRPPPPPGCTCWVREHLALSLFGYQKFVRDRMKKHSPSEVFKTSLLGEKTAVFCGARANKFIFTNENKLVAVWHPPSLKKVLLPEFAGSNYKEPMAIFHSFDITKPEALKRYVPVMGTVARQLVGGWSPNSVVKVLPCANNYTIELALRLFSNVVDPGLVEALAGPLALVSHGMMSLPVDLPGTAFNGAVKAAGVVRGEMMRIVKERREELRRETGEVQGRDMLSKMLLLYDEDDVYDAKVVSFILGMVTVSFDSTASAITAVVNFLAQLPHIYEEVLKEQMHIANSKVPDEPLTWEHLERMKYTWNVARESMRLLPPAPGIFREAIDDFTYEGSTIPKGWKTFSTPHSSHMSPDYFPEPEKFDPSRFEGSGPAPYTYIPFGGGPRMCPGRDYARAAILVFIHNVVTRFRLEKVVRNDKIMFHTRPTPAQGLPVRLHPHMTSRAATV